MEELLTERQGDRDPRELGQPLTGPRVGADFNEEWGVRNQESRLLISSLYFRGSRGFGESCRNQTLALMGNLQGLGFLLCPRDALSAFP